MVLIRIYPVNANHSDLVYGISAGRKKALKNEGFTIGENPYCVLNGLAVSKSLKNRFES